ncbi:TonB-dependent receptor [Flavobacterium psychrotrophum]|uniref:TonB-dependent receptor n=1 Tax=Flavobacterium psychrotrophum TaxID=2294119 RepID=UPI000E30C0AE|nr:TonB-dependent receptor [Flavobacterium psychrotrophum]
MLKKLLATTFILFSTIAFAQDTIQKQTTALDTTKLTVCYTVGYAIPAVIISNYHISNRPLDAPASISIVSAKDIQRNDNTNIATVLNTLPGVQMQSGAINTNRISIRGIGARTPYGTNKIRAFYGSIPLTSGDSETTIEDIDLEVINKIEVIKGPLSSLYGAGLGGAILIDPKYATGERSTATVSATAGSFGLLKNTYNYGYNTKSGSLNINYHKLESDGWRKNSSYYREGVTLAGDLFRKESSKLTYFGNYTYMKAYIPSSVSKTSFDNNPRAAAPTWAASKGYEQYHSYMGGLAYDFKITNWLSNATSVFINAKDSYEPRPFDILKQNSTGYGGRTQFTGNTKLGAIATHFIAGIEYFKDGYDGGTLENNYQDNNGNGTLQGDRLTANKQDRDFINAFAQLRLEFSKKLELQAGVNYNKTSFNLNNTFHASAASTQNYSYDGIWSPQVSLLFKPSEYQTVYASLSRGFSLPAIEETLTASGTINPNIKPENGYNIELGTKQFYFDRKLYLDLSLYRMEINDLLVAQRVGDDQYIGVNAGKTLHQGIEASASYIIPLTYNLETASGWTLIPYTALSVGKYEFKEFVNNDIDYSGNDLTGVPSTKVNAGLTLNIPHGLYLSSDYYYTGTTPINDANTVYNSSYNLLNAKAGWRYTTGFGLGLHISAGVNNITDTHYASMVLVNATGANGAPPRYYYPGLPVNYYGNMGVSYNF